MPRSGSAATTFLLTRYFVQKHAHRMGRNIDTIPTSLEADALRLAGQHSRITEPDRAISHLD
jgi:hypothetical protein